MIWNDHWNNHQNKMIRKRPCVWCSCSSWTSCHKHMTSQRSSCPRGRVITFHPAFIHTQHPSKVSGRGYVSSTCCPTTLPVYNPIKMQRSCWSRHTQSGRRAPPCYLPHSHCSFCRKVDTQAEGTDWGVTVVVYYSQHMDQISISNNSGVLVR